MTYAQVIAQVRARSLALKQAFPGFDSDAVLFALVVEKARELSMKTKDRQATASLSLVAGTATYTISSAIASDVDEIQLITIATGQIEPMEERRFREYVAQTSVSDDSGVVTPGSGTPLRYSVWNGVLTVNPVPESATTATVYYTVKIPTTLTFTRDALATAVALNDEFLSALYLAVIGEMYQTIGNSQRAVEYFTFSETKLIEGKNFAPNYDYGDTVRYHDLD